MTDRVPIFLPLSGETVLLSERVLRIFQAGVLDMNRAITQDSRTIPANGVSGVLLAGLEIVDSDQWNGLRPEEREKYLLWLMGCLEGMLTQMTSQDAGFSPKVAAMVH